jgi:hypothetical protein
MKLNAVFLAAIFLGLAAASVLLDAGLKTVPAVPARALAEPSAEEQKIIEFVLTTFDSLLASDSKSGIAYFKQADKKAPSTFGEPPKTKFEGDNFLGTYYFLLSKDNHATDARTIKDDVVLLWLHVGRFGKPGGKTPDPKSKKSSKDLAFEFTNGIVSSKIKVSYGFGGMELLKSFIVRSCFSYLMKVEQSVASLVSIEPLVQSFTANLESVFEPKTQKVPYQLHAKEVSRSLIVDYDGKKDSKTADNADKVPLIGSLLKDTKEALKKGKQETGPTTPEHLVYKITPIFDITIDPKSIVDADKPEYSAENRLENPPDYVTYIDTFYLLIIKVGNRAMVIIHSRHFSDSVEVSVNSKTTLIETVYNLIRKVVKETYQSFMDLDPNPTLCPTGIKYAEAKLPKLLFVAGGSLPQTEKSENEESGSTTTASMAFTKTVGEGYSIVATLSEEPTADIKVVVSLSKDGAERAKLQSYFPLNSQYCSGVFVTAYIKKVTEDFASIVYSEVIRNPHLTEGVDPRDAIKAHLGSRYSTPFLKDHSHTEGDKFLAFVYRQPQIDLPDCSNEAPSVKTDKPRQWITVLCKEQVVLGEEKEFRVKLMIKEA